MSMFIINRFGVYHWTNFLFEDGTSKDKYFISLNCTIDDQDILVVLPTSQFDKKYKDSDYYLQDTVIIEADTSIYFDKKTVIDFKNIKTVNHQNINENLVNYKGLLEKDIIKEIETTIANSKLLTDKQIKTLLCKENTK